MEKDKREQEKPRPRVRGSRISKILPEFLMDPVRQKTVIIVGLSLLISVLVAPSYMITSPSYELGEVADRNIKAKRDFLVEDEEATRRKREETVASSPVIFDLNDSIAQDIGHRLEKAFAAMRKLSIETSHPVHPDVLSPLKEGGSVDQDILAAVRDTGADKPAPSAESYLWNKEGTTNDAILEKRRDFETFLGINIPDDIYDSLVRMRFDPIIREKVVQLLQAVFDQGVVADKTVLLHTSGKDLITRKVQSHEEKALPPPHYFLDMEEARKYIRAQALELGNEMEDISVISALATRLLQPNLNFNLSETQLRKEAQANNVKPVYIQIKKNEMLVREGQRIGFEEFIKLQAYKQRKATHYNVLLFGIILFFTGFYVVVPLKVLTPHIDAFPKEVRDVCFLVLLTAVLLVMARFTVWMTDIASESSYYLTNKTLIFAFPLTAGAMLTSILFGVTFSLVFSLLLTTFAVMIFGRDFGTMVYFLVGTFIAVHGVSPCRNRMTPIRAGFMVGVTNVVLVFLGFFMDGQWDPIRMMLSALAGLWGGLFAGVLVTGLTPVAEILFEYTTDIKLLELATMDQPLMRELMVQVPGTYHHSIIVGNMVEAAAKSIGANSLLARVAAYYHDIGKIRKPLYFIENQFDCENRHEKLAPSMSSLILISHVKEGVEIARQHHLGRPIVDIIKQHHGTSLITFFYKKALDAREKVQNTKGAELPPIDIDDYRYPGPKPQTKEAGLVMLADVVEAACRSLTDPTPARIKGLVNKLINNIFIDGQLDECELTLKDLHSIARSFNQILATVHHKRIEYPKLPTGDGKGKTDAAASSNQREPKPDRDRQIPAQEDSKKDLKRLGLQ